MHHVLFRIGGFEIYSYGFVLVIAFLASVPLALRQARLEGISKGDIIDLCLYLLVGGVVGARLLYILLMFDEYLCHPLDMLNLRKGGLSWHGALLGGFIAAAIFSLRRGKPLGGIMDTISPSMMLGLGIGRIGCLLNGCCYGKPTDLPWGIVLSDAGIVGRRHPTQIYEMILDFVGMSILLIWQQKKRFRGEVFLGYMLIYSVIRFIVESFRESIYVFHGLSLAHYASIVLFAVSMIVILKARFTGSSRSGPN